MNFVAIDFETANHSRKNACSIGMVKYIDGKKIDTFYSLIKPPTNYFRSNFIAIHGLTMDTVKDAPTFSELWNSKILPFIGDLPLAAHNAQFDISVLCANLKYYELSYQSFNYFCSLQLAKRTWLSEKSYALSSLANIFGIKYQAHNALDDAETCGKIILMSADFFNCKNVDELLNITNIKIKETK
jgi:DNA polymerase-3 subunit epsilon